MFASVWLSSAAVVNTGVILVDYCLDLILVFGLNERVGGVRGERYRGGPRNATPTKCNFLKKCNKKGVPKRLEMGGNRFKWEFEKCNFHKMQPKKGVRKWLHFVEPPLYCKR